MRTKQLLGVLALVGTAALSTGCLVNARARATASADAPVVFSERPTLVAAGSGVWVVRASARATYYVDDYYWVWGDGAWYRSSTWSGGWVVVEANVVPTVIVKRDHTLYVNYSGEANAATKPAPGAEDDSKHPHGGPPGKEALPGVGNNRKADGEQPGQVGKGLTKDDDDDKGKAAKPDSNPAKKDDKKDDDKKDDKGPADKGPADKGPADKGSGKKGK
jgi:hypothetical protein